MPLISNRSAPQPQDRRKLLREWRSSMQPVNRVRLRGYGSMMHCADLAAMQLLCLDMLAHVGQWIELLPLVYVSSDCPHVLAWRSYSRPELDHPVQYRHGLNEWTAVEEMPIYGADLNCIFALARQDFVEALSDVSEPAREAEFLIKALLHRTSGWTRRKNLIRNRGLLEHIRAAAAMMTARHLQLEPSDRASCWPLRWGTAGNDVPSKAQSLTTNGAYHGNNHQRSRR